jgi:hypothetical protein
MEILLDGVKLQETSARTATLPNLGKGLHTIEVRSVKVGKPISASKVINLELGTIAELKLTPR